MADDEYTTITTVGQGSYTEKRSKFLAWAHHVETPDQVKQLLAHYRKTYYDADMHEVSVTMLEVEAYIGF